MFYSQVVIFCGWQTCRCYVLGPTYFMRKMSNFTAVSDENSRSLHIFGEECIRKFTFPSLCDLLWQLLHRFNSPLSGTTRMSWYHKGNQEGRTNLDLLEQEIVSGSGISWAVCKAASRPRQITMPAPHHSVLQARCPSCRPCNSIKTLKAFKRYRLLTFIHHSSQKCSLCF